MNQMESSIILIRVIQQCYIIVLLETIIRKKDIKNICFLIEYRTQNGNIFGSKQTSFRIRKA